MKIALRLIRLFDHLFFRALIAHYVVESSSKSTFLAGTCLCESQANVFFQNGM